MTHKFKGPRPSAMPPIERIAHYLGTAGITEEQTKALRWLFAHEMKLLQQKEMEKHEREVDVLKVFLTGALVMGFAILIYHFFWVW